MPRSSPQSPCPKCGKPKSKGADRCWDCFRLEEHAPAVRMHPIKLGGANASRERVTVENLLKYSPKAKAHICPSSQSPNQRHHYVLDADSRGQCRYCGEPGYFPSSYKWRDVL